MKSDQDRKLDWKKNPVISVYTRDPETQHETFLCYMNEKAWNKTIESLWHNEKLFTQGGRKS